MGSLPEQWWPKTDKGKRVKDEQAKPNHAASQASQGTYIQVAWIPDGEVVQVLLELNCVGRTAKHQG